MLDPALERGPASRRLGSLFSGVGMLERGLEIGGGFEVAFQAEKDDWCRRVLARHYPGVQLYDDVWAIGEDAPPVVALCGGFPCQPVSQAGRGKAQDDERWLWPGYDHAIRLLEPELVIVENVEGLYGRGLGIVTADLARAGYDAEWDCIPAAAVRAPHLRYRVFLVARRRPDGPRGTFCGPGALDSLRALPPWPDEEPFLPRLKREVPLRRRRLEALGNAVVVQVAAWVGSRLDADEAPKLAALPAFAELDEEGWREAHGSLLGRWPFEETWPRAGVMVDGVAYETPRLVPIQRTKGDLWPTPAARESGWTLETLMECVDANGETPETWDQRFYNPETGQIVQRGLPQVVEGVERGLWKTPTAAPFSDGGGGGELHKQARGVEAEEAEEDEAQVSWPTPRVMSNRSSRVAMIGDRHDGQWAAPSLEQAAELAEGIVPRELEGEHELNSTARKYWPTPVTTDAKGSRRTTAQTDEWDSNLGETLTDAVWIEEEMADAYARPAAPDDGQLALFGENAGAADDARWPTPRATDGDRGGRGDLIQAARGNESPSGHFRGPTLPTPAATDWKGVSKPGQRRGQLEEAVRFPTPLAGDASGSRGSKGKDRPDEGGLRKAAEAADEQELYPTPAASDATGGRVTGEEDRERGYRREDGTKVQRTLGDAAREAEREALWPTPQARDYKGPQGNSYDGTADDLPGAVSRAEGSDSYALWPTPKATPSGPDYARVDREESGGDDLATAAARDNDREPGGGLNPSWVEWLMGAPPGWTLPDGPPLR